MHRIPCIIESVERNACRPRHCMLVEQEDNSGSEQTRHGIEKGNTGLHNTSKLIADLDLGSRRLVRRSTWRG